ncbi:hypothetical protein GTQ48_09450 [Alteromonas genovensis]|uniref:DUF1269 domain-containing protein n=1 Tax=Alteromonas genovensis TaxID=471225 RepID=A0A6N9TGY9_9ALTE|nr:hypothetical protein [Alteromonas genovensis]NDW15742.1 hypothetical protein [Alteromonas genovensis]
MKSNSQNTTTSQESSNPNIRAAIVSSDKLQVAAIFDTTDEAKIALRRVEEETNVASHQSELIEPCDPKLSEKLEQKSSSIANTLWTSHLALSGIGFVIGMIAAFLLTQYGPALTQQNPWFTHIALISPGTFIGMFVAGLIALRPDRNEIVLNVSDAARNGKSALIINLHKSQSAKTISGLLQQQSNNVVQSIK